MDDLVVRVKSPVMAACMTCPLCHELLDEATTIPLCLHTFCRKCIHDMLSVKDVDSCPICNSDLGCSPINKLRPDHALRSLREKIFPQKNKETEISGTMPPVALPTKRKERSLSSSVTLPRVTGRRVASCHTSASPFEEHSPKSDDPSKDYLTETKPAESPKKSGEAKGTESRLKLPEREYPTPLAQSQVQYASEPSTNMPRDLKMLLTQLISLLEVEIFTAEDFAYFENIKQPLEEYSDPPFELRGLLHMLKSHYWVSWDEYKTAIQARDDIEVYQQRWSTPSTTAMELDHQRAQIIMLEERDKFLIAQINRLQAERVTIAAELPRVHVKTVVFEAKLEEEQRAIRVQQRALSSEQILAQPNPREGSHTKDPH